jgi:hypothetical protein
MIEVRNKGRRPKRSTLNPANKAMTKLNIATRLAVVDRDPQAGLTEACVDTGELDRSGEAH